MSDLHVIVGLGVTGLSCARFLKARHIPFAMLDTRPNPPNLDEFKKLFPDVEVVVGGWNTELLAKARRIVLSPGIGLNTPEIQAVVQRGISVIGDVELFAESPHRKVIAITGTNAKSTVTTLVGMMVKAAGLSVQTGGNLGVPVLDLYLEQPDADVFVLELSSFQLETTYSLRPTVATILNITPDHMDRYATYEDYQAAKHRVYLHAEKAVCNRDDPLTDTSAVSNKLFFTLNKPAKNEFGLCVEDNQTYLTFENQLLMPVSDLPVRGKHYQANALASLALGYALGLPIKTMLAVLREFPGLPHRCQFIRERNGICWYNDSKGTNVGATQAAICGLGGDMKNKLVLIAGGVGKNADFSPLAPLLKQYVRHVVLIGEARDAIASAIDGSVPISFAQSLEEAVAEADQYAETDDFVLLSPACASFDMFKNYEHRGDVFMDIVKKL